MGEEVKHRSTPFVILSVYLILRKSKGLPAYRGHFHPEGSLYEQWWQKVMNWDGFPVFKYVKYVPGLPSIPEIRGENQWQHSSLGLPIHCKSQHTFALPTNEKGLFSPTSNLVWAMMKKGNDLGFLSSFQKGKVHIRAVIRFGDTRPNRRLQHFLGQKWCRFSKKHFTGRTIKANVCTRVTLVGSDVNFRPVPRSVKKKTSKTRLEGNCLWRP